MNMLKAFSRLPINRNLLVQTKRSYSQLPCIRRSITNTSLTKFKHFYSQPKNNFNTAVKKNVSQNTHLWPKIIGVASLGMATIGGGIYYATVLGPRIHAPATEVLPVLNITEPPAFKHPFDDKNWAWKVYFKAKRFIYLCCLFVPCAALYVTIQITDSESWRAYWLEMLVSTLEAAGCSFQKFGQWLSMRPDMFSPDVIEALSKLRDQVPAHDIKHTRRMIRESLGKEIEDIFEEFDAIPVASGTIAQVHRGILKPEYAKGGPSHVAVKVRHPHVLDETFVDCDMIFQFMEAFPMLTVPFSKPDFVTMLQQQIDFHWEAYNLAKFSDNFQKEIASGKVFFPDVKQDLLSACILVETWAPGKSVSEILSKVGFGFKQLVNEFNEGVSNKKRELARTLFDLNMKMFLRDNLVHGDLHGGNVLYNPDSNCCTVLDAGMTTSMGDDIKDDFGCFVQAVCCGNMESLTQHILMFQDPNSALSGVGVVKHQDTNNQGNHVELDVPEEVQEKLTDFQNDVQDILTKHIAPNGMSAPDGNAISLGDILGQLMFCLQRHQIQLRGDVAASILTMSVSEGLIRALDPEFDVVRAALPYFIRYR